MVLGSQQAGKQLFPKHHSWELYGLLWLLPGFQWRESQSLLVFFTFSQLCGNWEFQGDLWI